MMLFGNLLIYQSQKSSKTTSQKDSLVQSSAAKKCSNENRGSREIDLNMQ